MALLFDKVTKIITVPASDGTEITIQNLLNGIREYEDELTTLDMPRIVSCAGKEPLGGGVVIGLTLTLLDDWQLAFEARGGPTYIQCAVSGGNIVAVNVNGAIYPTAFTQVLITASSSATQSDLEAIQYASFGGGVTIDVVNGLAGTSYPIGTIEHPVNNISDSLIIAITKGFNKIYLISNISINNYSDLAGYKLEGTSHINTLVTIEESAIVDDINIFNCHITGVLDGGVDITFCVIENITYMAGHIHNSSFIGVITLGGGGDGYIDNCKQLDVNIIPEINMGGSGQNLVMSIYSGNVKITNLTGNNKANIGLNHGTVILDTATVTNGIIEVGGTGNLTDELGNNILSGTWNAGVTIINGLVNKYNIANEVWDSDEAQRILNATEIESAEVDDLSASTTKFITTLTETTNNFWDRASILFTSGQNKGQIRGIKNYLGGSKEVTIQTPLSFQPANEDTFIIIIARKFLTPDVEELANAVLDSVA